MPTIAKQQLRERKALQTLMMLVPSIQTHLPRPLTVPGNRRSTQKLKTTTAIAYAKKVDDNQVDDKPGISSRSKNPITLLLDQKLRFTNYTLAKLAVTVFGLGFVDAGYSGDWSRINVISKETEEFLKLATFLLVPLCIFCIYSISNKEKNSN